MRAKQEIDQNLCVYIIEAKEVFSSHRQLMGSPHALIIPYPAQGHVIPLMELSHCLVDHGFNITFINTEFNHDRVVAALSERGGKIHPMIQLIPIPDGLAPEEDRNNLGRLCEGSVAAMPGHLEEIIEKSKKSEGGRITWMIADKNMAWALEVAKKTGIRAAAFWPASAALLATMMSIPKLVEDGILDDDGMPKQCVMIELIPGMPPMDTAHFPWIHVGDSKARKIIFEYINNNTQAAKLAEFIICNSFYELESPVFAYRPALIPVGPLIADQRFEKPVGTFWAEDAGCISWLDKQPANSVIYVAFGSFTILNRHQFQELALGLELTGRPFLWVVRPDLTDGRNDAYPIGFRDRVASRGMIVDWSPQQKVLAHPSIACFLSHCGWNSTIEGVRNGVPFLCRPYFTDQFLNQSCICDVWKIGVRMDPDDSRVQIKAKAEELLVDEDIKMRSLRWREMASNSVRDGGSSTKNFNSIISVMKNYENWAA